MYSINSRLRLAASVVLTAFLGVGAVALDRAYIESSESALESRMMGHVYALLGAAETDQAGRMRLPPNLPDPRLTNPDSGLYAMVSGEEGTYLWRSPSALGRNLPATQARQPGEALFEYLDQNTPLYRLAYSLLWEDDAGREVAYHFTLLESADGVKQQVAVFRRTIGLWLGGAALVLLLMQGAVLRWGLKPLRTVARDLQLIEQGDKVSLEGDYPHELKRLTLAINSLIRHSTASRDRYRNSLGDLAHSLKTPLAVLQGAAEGGSTQQLQEAVTEQVPRMNEIVQYHLKSASAAGRGLLSTGCRVRPAVERLNNTLQKVYRDKRMQLSCGLDEEWQFPLERQDLLEVIGNVLENAFKYGRRHIRIEPLNTDHPAYSGDRVAIAVNDDGPGIPEAVRNRVVVRGERADERMPGQGIGLSVSREILRQYGGGLMLGSGPLGGAEVVIWLPARPG